MPALVCAVTQEIDFYVGRGAKYPVAFLHDWMGTLVRVSSRAMPQCSSCGQ